MTIFRTSFALIAALAVVASACGGASTSTPSSTIELVSAQEAAELVADPPAGLVVLDVRTPDEFAQGHLANAILIDFYEPDFRDRLAELDRDVPYLVYCRSGNRSRSAVEMMKELGFRHIYEIDGGIQAWASAQLPIER